MATAVEPAPPVARLRRFDRELLERPTPAAARALLGAYVVREVAGELSVGRIVEAEAYGGPEDRASHARAGLTPRTEPMFGIAGLAYVYLVYGMHECLNVVAHEEGRAGAVLLRALQPVAGSGTMRLRRGRPAEAEARLAAGPGRLCRALAVDRSLSGHDLLRGERLWLALADGEAVSDGAVASGPRVGVAYAGEEWAGRPWRFWLRGHPSVSRP